MLAELPSQSFTIITHLEMGSFQAMASHDAIKTVIGKFLSLGVKKVGGSHCTGKRAMQLFKAKYGKNYIQMSVGKIIPLN